MVNEQTHPELLTGHFEVRFPSKPQMKHQLKEATDKNFGLLVRPRRGQGEEEDLF